MRYVIHFTPCPDVKAACQLAAIPMTGLIVAAALLSGLIPFIESSHQSALAQQNTTGTTDATIGGSWGGGLLQ